MSPTASSPWLSSSRRVCDLEPWAHLRHVLRLLPDWPEHHLLNLPTLRWAKTLTHDDVRSRLDANRFRELTLGRRC
ncbi:MAG TPA: hypothetical protein VGG39_14630 [Polyangiaceae bacterium]|jgi:hypothetical protein